MRILPLMIGAALAAPVLAADTPAESDSPKAMAALARATAGRTAGTPVDCIARRPSGDFSVAGRHLIFRVNSRTTYVNTPTAGCDTGLGRQSLVFRSTSSRLCRGDVVEAVDPLGGAAGGSCVLGSFTPWARP